MAAEKKIRIAIVGLGFGAEFIPIYQKHPHADMYAICRRTKKDLDECGDRWGIKVRYSDFDKLLQDPNVDAVHINSPIPDHAPQSVAALKAGKHVACTVLTAGSTCMRSSCTTRGCWVGFSSCVARTSRKWQVGPGTGRACRPCTMPPIASAPA